jgi:hypothetical protein
MGRDTVSGNATPSKSPGLVIPFSSDYTLKGHRQAYEEAQRTTAQSGWDSNNAFPAVKP